MFQSGRYSIVKGSCFVRNCYFIMSTKRKRSSSKSKFTSVKKRTGTEEADGFGQGNTGGFDQGSFHQFSEAEVVKFRKDLLSWYDKNKRVLPWRTLATACKDDNIRGYGVWVSEIMLQQTQVATTIDYYNKWMKKWPTVQDLAKASLEEVNQAWAGLGYYSRARRLHEGAKKIVEELNGEFPNTTASLIKEIPGVGRYSAGAIGSIAFGRATGVVDGNVIRVLTRLRKIGADSTGPVVMDTLWNIADTIVDSDRPGDFNQAMMELGATVCLPKTPSCKTCPVNNYCKAYQQVEYTKSEAAKKLGQMDASENIPDIEDCDKENCKLCPSDDVVYDSSLGVQNYPYKGKKRALREEKSRVFVVQQQNQEDAEYMVLQRPKTGLLAGLWEFYSVPYSDMKISDCLREAGINMEQVSSTKEVGEIVHIFSHIHQTYAVCSVTLKSSFDRENLSGKLNQPIRWVTRDQFLQDAVSTAMKKVFKFYEAKRDYKSTPKEIKRKKKGLELDKTQKTLSSFFKPVNKS